MKVRMTVSLVGLAMFLVVAAPAFACACSAPPASYLAQQALGLIPDTPGIAPSLPDGSCSGGVPVKANLD